MEAKKLNNNIRVHIGDMKMTIKRFLYGVVGILLAMAVYWFAARYFLRGSKTEPFSGQTQLASRRTEVSPADEDTNTENLFDNTGLPSYVMDSSRVERPYLTNPINSLDDYEYNLVFQNEGSRELSQESKNVLTSAYPFDWSNYPPSAAKFQEGQSDLYMAKPTDPIPSDTYKAIEAASLQPPNMDAVEEDERKILATYAPKHAGNMTTYDVEDARELINKIYDKKGLIPEVKEMPNNVYEVVYTQSKDPKIEYEDDPAPNGGGDKMYSDPKAFDVISVPIAPRDVSAGLDPYYEPRNGVRTSRTDYMRWTPGLERQFAPTYDKKDWY